MLTCLKDDMKNLIVKAAFVAVLTAPLALAACSGPTAENSAGATQSAGSQSTGTDAATSPGAAAQTSAGNGSGPIANPKSEILIGLKERLEAKPEFAGLPDSCKATATRMMVGLAAPLASAMEEIKPGNVQKAKDAIAEVQGTTPPELEPTFSKLEAMVDQPTANFDQAGFETAFTPISDWLSKNCNGFSAQS